MTVCQSGVDTVPGRCGQDFGADGEDIRGSRRLQHRLAHGDLAAVREVRRGLRELLRQCGSSDAAGAVGASGAIGVPDPAAVADLADVAELLTSELVTNALIHTDRGAVVTAGIGPSGLRVEVRDFAAGRPERRARATSAGTHGRGLVLVESLADAWGVRTHGLGKVVWFELGPVPGAAPGGGQL
ncbi:ATP-binding protein [Streptomyces sp. NBC_01267]|uniref:ATP-binding protein n=1 Tax=Streptomyces sp. NBC_01267 TaxID=2903805 RepID=UPI002E302482|nr:ATP-binding protein [Streptomyces sp. NBC_01267]